MSTSEREESEVEEAECRGESAGETAAEDSESVTVLEVTVRLRAGFCLGRAEVDAIVKEGIRPTEEKVEMPKTKCPRERRRQVKRKKGISEWSTGAEVLK